MVVFVSGLVWFFVVGFFEGSDFPDSRYSYLN